MEEVPIANLVIDEEIQIDDNVFVSFEEMNIRHRKFRDLIDRLAEVQMCLSWFFTRHFVTFKKI